VVGSTKDRYYLDPDVHQKCEELRSNQPLFLVSSVRHWTHLESMLPSTMGSIQIEIPFKQNLWMFANWYAELNFFCLATFPPVSGHPVRSFTHTQFAEDVWERKVWCAIPVLKGLGGDPRWDCTRLLTSPWFSKKTKTKTDFRTVGMEIY